ncbi:YlaF family protein [Jeotgalibacillus sp. JSM ZJ347]|uniref:YlaF family protein n=1 Tax=Jeotgalibacillus sp. JSM ZJ347 TaxID=3342117 RepID=UPI0035A8A069
MKNNAVFLLYAFAAVIAMSGIGVAIAERSAIGAIVSILAVIVVFGMGFKTKKRFREQAEN